MKLIVRAAILALTTIAGSTPQRSRAGQRLEGSAPSTMDAQGSMGWRRKGIQTGASDAGRKLDVVETNAQGHASKSRLSSIR